MENISNNIFAEAVLECLTVELKLGSEVSTFTIAAQALDRACQKVLNRTSSDWTIQPVQMQRLHIYDLLPPSTGETISVSQAWDIYYQLLEQEGIFDADISFEHNLNNFPTSGEMLDNQPTGANLASSSRSDSCRLSDNETGDDESDCAWNLKFVKAQKAWELPPRNAVNGFDSGKSRGAGIKIWHPDSGYRDHVELWDNNSQLPNRIRADLGKDFVSNDLVTKDRDGNHGLGTASVIISTDNSQSQVEDGGVIFGIAPEAELIPLRVAKKRPLVPIPVLLRSGMRRLRDAILYAIEQPEKCHVISISLGWLKYKYLHDAIKEAVKHNVIICAAAGNVWPWVVWPARYPEVIAVAGCTAQRKKWQWSSRGKSVEVTAPAQNVWRAIVNDDGIPAVEASGGTSFAVATTAGIAALWLAHHGRDYLLDRYQGEFTLSTVFRKVLTEACDAPPEDHNGDFGVGIVNAEATLKRELPTLAQMRGSMFGTFDSFASVPADNSIGGLAKLEDTFDLLPKKALRENLASMLDVDVEELDRHLMGLGDELTFHLLTNPKLRETLVELDRASTTPIPLATSIGSNILKQLLVDNENLSSRFRSRMNQ